MRSEYRGLVNDNGVITVYGKVVERPPIFSSFEELHSWIRKMKDA